MDPEAERILGEQLKQLYLNRKVHFGNGRTVRNIFEKAINIQANRIAVVSDPSDEELEMLTAEDINAALDES